jgi:hypothetical protein
MEVRAAVRKTRTDVLAGIEAGVIGGVLMLGWFALTMPVLAQPWWLIPNLLATGIYGNRDTWSGPGFMTLAGSALQVFSAGVIGVVNGLLTPGGRLFGLALAAFWYIACYLFLWKRLSPGMLFYAPQPVLIAGYFLYGSVLGWHTHFARRV